MRCDEHRAGVGDRQQFQASLPRCGTRCTRTDCGRSHGVGINLKTGQPPLQILADRRERTIGALKPITFSDVFSSGADHRP